MRGVAGQDSVVRRRAREQHLRAGGIRKRIASGLPHQIREIQNQLGFRDPAAADPVEFAGAEERELGTRLDAEERRREDPDVVGNACAPGAALLPPVGAGDEYLVPPRRAGERAADGPDQAVDDLPDSAEPVDGMGGVPCRAVLDSRFCEFLEPGSGAS